MTLCEQKSVCDSLLSNIDTSGFVLKTKYNTDKSDLEKKISDPDKKVPDTSGLVWKKDKILKVLKKRVKYLVSVV